MSRTWDFVQQYQQIIYISYFIRFKIGNIYIIIRGTKTNNKDGENRIET